MCILHWNPLILIISFRVPFLAKLADYLSPYKNLKITSLRDSTLENKNWKKITFSTKKCVNIFFTVSQ